MNGLEEGARPGSVSGGGRARAAFSPSSMLTRPVLQRVKKQQSSGVHHWRIQLTAEMFDKLLELRDSLPCHVFDSGSSDDGDDSSSSKGSTTSLTFEDSSKSILLKGPTEAILNKTCQDLKLFLPPQDNDQLGLSGLSRLASDHKALRSAASWDVTYDSFNRHKDNAKRSHSSSEAVMTSYEKEFQSRRKLEAEDSSYDSDHDPTQRGVAWGQSHGEISRKTSETLAAEFAEYVTVRKDEDVLVQDEDYRNKVLFAVRLGYTELQLQKALLKLGRNAGQNQLLEELIRLQKSTPTADKLQHASKQEVVPKASLPTSADKNDDGFLPIVIDGSNVAMSHGNKDRFSCKGIKICVDWFKARGHKEITVFVPKWRKESSKPESPTTDQHILIELEREGLLSFTPSRQVLGKRIVSHDDRYILNLAAETGAVVVSNDNFRELINEKPEFKKVIEEKVLMYSFVKERFMPPDDPLGKNGPSLAEFLKLQTKSDIKVCPYGKKCTYGNKCKFYHADRGNQPQKSITDTLRDHQNLKMKELCARTAGSHSFSRDSSPGDHLTRTMSMQPPMNMHAEHTKQQLCRAKSSVSRMVGDGRYYPQPQHKAWPTPSDGSANWQTAMSGPPPPPRSPWNNSGSGEVVNSHKKLARQLTINPNYDPRIHPLQNQNFNYPPPTVQPFFSSPEGNQDHQNLTRNSSAPEQQPGLMAQHQMMPNLMQLPPPLPPQPTRHYPDPLHKTMSDSFVWGSGALPAEREQRQQQQPPLAWDNRELGPIGSRPSYHEDVSRRSDIMYHLSSIFPKEVVERAMDAFPEETNPKILCQHILADMNAKS